MKRIYFSKLAILVTLLLGTCIGGYAQSTTTTFSYTGAMQSYVVPSGALSVAIDARGAAGGTSSYGQGGPGPGGRVQCVLTTVSGQTLFIFVGGLGANSTGSTGTIAGGYNGGGTAYYVYGGSGGGATDIRVGGTGLNNRIIVAGGGGGGGLTCSGSGASYNMGGAGGGLTGGNGFACGSNSGTNYQCYWGSGGTQLGGGTGGTCGSGLNGTSGIGGPGYTSYYGGGGGGGYYGGGGAYGGGGGGGSSYPASNGGNVSALVHTQGYNATGNGSISITTLFPTVNTSVPSFNFGTVPVGTQAVPQFTVLTGIRLTPASGTITLTVPGGAGYQLSTDGISWSNSVTISYSGGVFPAQNLYVSFTPTAALPYNNLITVTGGGINTMYIPINGAGATTTCSGSPSVGTPTITPITGDATTPFTLDIPSLSPALGYSYQWQTATASTGPWSNIPGAIQIDYSFVGISASTFYRCAVTCAGGGVTNSAAVSATYAFNLYANGCSGIPNPGFAFSPVTTGCAPYADNIFNVGATTDSGISHQWQSSPDGLSWTNLTGVGVASVATSQFISGTLYFQDVVTCPISGKSAITAPVQLILNSPPAPISGNTNICTSTPSPLSSTTPFGTWTTSNPAIAQVNTSGFVTGYGAGTATISYTLATGCFVTSSVVVNSSPSSITGALNVCTTQITTLASLPTTGTWSSSNASAASVDPTGHVTGLTSGTNPIITYTLPSGCTAMSTLTVNQLPAPITGSHNVCIGGNTTLGETVLGGTWTSSNSFQVGVSSGTGFVSGVLASVNTITYTLAGGCFATVPMTVNVLPNPISGSTGVCVGATTTLSDGGSGNWNVSNTSVATVGGTTGVVSGIAAGSATVTYTLAGTGCTITQLMTVNPTPTAFSVTGGGGYCTGTSGTHVGLSGSATGVDYNLYNAGGIVASQPGSSSGLDFGLMTATGVYTVQAVDHSTLCTSNMTGSTSISINSLPASYALSTSGGVTSFCSGGLGVDMMLSGSDLGVNYQLYNGSTLIKSVPGTGAPTSLDLGLHPAGTYTVIGTNTTTLCAAGMGGSAVITANIPPVAQNIATPGSASYCAGTGGVDIQLISSDASVTYNLYRSGSIFTASVTGTGSAVDFGNQGTTGCYTVVGVDANGCQTTMLGNKCVSINPLPNVYTATGGGPFCAGSMGVHVGVNYSLTGTNYQLALLGTGIVSTTPVPGANSGIDLGVYNAPGNYRVIATNGFGCTDTMLGTANVVMNSAPVNSYVVGGGGGYCAGSSGSVISLSGSEPGIIYRLQKGSGIVTSYTGTGSNFNFGTYTATGTYFVTALNTATGCGDTIPGSVNVTINALPKAYTMLGGGGYCAGDPNGVHIKLSTSDPTVTYTLYLGGSPVLGTSMLGNGGVLDFGTFTTPGVYTAVGLSSSSCSQGMIGSVTVFINPLPAVNTTSVSGTGSYCAGGAGLHILLSGSNSGIAYQLLNGTGIVGVPLSGTSAPLDFGLRTAAGTYTIVATNVLTGCMDTMAGSGTINVVALPSIYAIQPTAGTQYCPGGTGVGLQLTGSDLGFSYDLYSGSTWLKKVPGTGGGVPLSFGGTWTAGTYTAIASDDIYGCTANMPSSVTVTTYTAPTAFSVTGTGSYCPTGSSLGLPVGLANSSNGVSYQLYNTSGTVGGPIFGISGSPIPFGSFTSDTYTIVGTDTTTTCANNMSGKAVITASTPDVPAVTITAPASDTISVCSGSTATLSAVPVNGGATPSYLWMVNGALMPGTSATFTYKPTTTTTDTVIAIIKSSEACVSSDSVASGAAYVAVNPGVMPTIAVNTASASICKTSTPVLFTSTISNGGTAPVYQWKLNGLPVGTSSPTLSTVISDKDKVFCVLASNADCALSEFVYSSPEVMEVYDVVTPVFQLLADPGTNVSKGDNVTFTALVTSDTTHRTTYTYQWSKNNVAIVGATGGVYMTNSLTDNDNISCTVTSKNSCGVQSNSGNVFMAVSTLGVKNVGINGDVRIVPNPNKGAFTVKGTLSSVNDEEVSLEITNMLGQTVYSSKFIAHNGNINEQLQLANTLANGMYLLNLNSGAEHKVFHFVIGQ